MPMSPEQKEKASARMKAYHAERKAKKEAAEAALLDVQPAPMDVSEPLVFEVQERQRSENYNPGKGAIIPGWRRAGRMRQGQRSITMLDPRCAVCQGGDNAPRDWYRDCPHDPYVSLKQDVTERPVYGKAADGSVIIERTEKVVAYVILPNTREITLSMRVNSGTGIERARAKGFILPSELRSPAYPNGIADCCQFRDCKWQQGLERYRSGTFCRELEAQLVAIDDAGTTLEVGWGSPESGQIRSEQLAAARI